ncbi:MAG TPA: hypothetical protein VGB73_13685 [Pyrinomonadaceae bacterium]|jgi:thymidylate kinase
MTKILEPFGSQLKWDVGGASPQSEGALAMPLVGEEMACEPATVNASAVVARAIEEVSERAQTNRGVLPLVERLCEMLSAEQISFCHWKSNWKLERWLTGEGDLDLLVERKDAERFLAVVSRLGFKQALPTPDRDVPAVLNYYGFDSSAGKFLHLHVHFQLVLGHDLTKNFRLSIERAYLESADAQRLMPTPAPEFELITFVLRMVLKYSATETLLRRAFTKRGASSGSSLRRELEYLEARADRAELHATLSEHLPFIDSAFFDACADSLRAGASAFERLRVRRGLKRRLSAQGRRSNPSDALTMSGRRIARFVREGIFKKSSRKRLAKGGAVVALVGGDGAGKTTCVEELHSWLSKKFVTRKFHMGRPPRSPLTLGVIVLLRLRRLLTAKRETEVQKHETDAQGHPPQQSKPFPGYIQLLRWVCAARDRHRLYRKLRRFAGAGGIAICDRYLVPQISLMDGPNIARSIEPSRMNGLVRLMLRAETDYYSRIMPADLLVVLRVEPEIAVRRKTDEAESHVRTRSRELWEIDWSDTHARVVDAGRPVGEVVARLKSLVWSEL